MSLDHFKRQASYYINERFRAARLVFTDVTPIELLAEEITNSDPNTPNAKAMTRIADASFDVDDYWRIVDVLHNRLHNIEWKQWKQSYKALVLLEFLLTHGPEELADEFKSDSYVIQELGTFKHVDENGLNWGEIMHKKSHKILELLKGGQTLRESRLKAIKVTREIQGFGSNSLPSPSSVSSSSSTSSPTLSFATSTSSFGSHPTTSPTWTDFHETNKLQKSSFTDEPVESHLKEKNRKETTDSVNIEELCIWDCPPIEEDDCLLDYQDEERPTSFLSGVCSKLAALSPRSAERAGYRKTSNKIED